jgi:hypothetical protein
VIEALGADSDVAPFLRGWRKTRGFSRVPRVCETWPKQATFTVFSIPSKKAQHRNAADYGVQDFDLANFLGPNDVKDPDRAGGTDPDRPPRGFDGLAAKATGNIARIRPSAGWTWLSDVWTWQPGWRRQMLGNREFCGNRDFLRFESLQSGSSCDRLSLLAECRKQLVPLMWRLFAGRPLWRDAGDWMVSEF